jgi:hypothetical protein
MIQEMKTTNVHFAHISVKRELKYWQKEYLKDISFEAISLRKSLLKLKAFVSVVSFKHFSISAF